MLFALLFVVLSAPPVYGKSIGDKLDRISDTVGDIKGDLAVVKGQVQRLTQAEAAQELRTREFWRKEWPQAIKRPEFDRYKSDSDGKLDKLEGEVLEVRLWIAAAAGVVAILQVIAVLVGGRLLKQFKLRGEEEVGALGDVSAAERDLRETVARLEGRLEAMAAGPPSARVTQSGGPMPPDPAGA